MEIPTAILSSGHAMPLMAFGVGTKWYKQNNRPLVDAVKLALHQGYRHLDCAEMYETSQAVGIAIKEFLAETGLPRSSLFITDKVSSSFANIKEAAAKGLRDLGVDYLDLYLLHVPFFAEKGVTSFAQAWSEMEELVRSGLVRSIGVSNFRVKDLQQLLPLAMIKPAINQVEFNPYLQQQKLKAFCALHNIQVMAYSPLGPIVNSPNGPVDPVIRDLADKYGKTPGQILIRWNLHRGNGVLNTSDKGERMQEYLNSTSYRLTDEDVETIDEAGSKKFFRRFFAEQFAENDAQD